jgi:hypothetical protein
MNKIRSLWNKIPEQIRRLSILLFAVIIVYLAVRLLMIPSDFGILGHYRASSITANLQKTVKYAGEPACNECHEDTASAKRQGYHGGVACESCHGPAIRHVQDPEHVKPAVNRNRSLCLLCHGYLPTRPTGFPQVISNSHNPSKLCVFCHHPHDPKTPQPLKKCEACHAKIQSQLSLSNHSGLDCMSCHEVDKQHYVQPRENPPKRMLSRQVCLRCHNKTLSHPEGIATIDGTSHGEKYLCWQCHYPHMPEAR